METRVSFFTAASNTIRSHVIDRTVSPKGVLFADLNFQGNF